MFVVVPKMNGMVYPPVDNQMYVPQGMTGPRSEPAGQVKQEAAEPADEGDGDVGGVANGDYR